MAPVATRRSVRLATGLFLTAVVATVLAPGASASAMHPVHCDSDGNHSLWIGAYLDQFDPSDPSTWQSGIVEQGLVCCVYNWHYGGLVCEWWSPLGDSSSQ